MTIVDTNILSDVLSGDPNWLDWSAHALAAQSRAGRLRTTDVVYAELSMRMPSVAELDAFLEEMRVELDRTPRGALFRAARAYRRYRANAGTRTGVLPDFFIGAHAEVAGVPILTRDTRRYRTYFPEVALIAPA